MWQDARERIGRRHRKFLRADGFGEGQPASGLQKRLVRDALAVDTVSGPNHGLLIAEYVPRIADPWREISRAEARRQRATRNSGRAADRGTRGVKDAVRRRRT